MKLPDEYWTPDNRYSSGYRLTPEGRRELARKQRLRRRWWLLSLAFVFCLMVLMPIGAAANIGIFTASPFLVAATMIGYGIHRGKINNAAPVSVVSVIAEPEEEPLSVPLTVVPEPLGPTPGGVARKREFIPSALKRQVWLRDNGCCRHCHISDADAMERDGEHLQYDHVLPFSRNGSTELDNLQLLCKPCNRTKSAKFAG